MGISWSAVTTNMDPAKLQFQTIWVHFELTAMPFKFCDYNRRQLIVLVPVNEIKLRRFKMRSKTD